MTNDKPLYIFSEGEELKMEPIDKDQRIEELEAQIKSLEEEVVWWTHAAFSWKADAEDKTTEQVQEEWFKEQLAKYPIIDLPPRKEIQ